MASPRVLIVEDDADINHIVATHLARCGYSCVQAFSGTEAKLLLTQAREHAPQGCPSEQSLSKTDDTARYEGQNALKTYDSVCFAEGQPRESFDVVICDLMLPGITGEELVALIRSYDASTPIVVTSARTAASDKIDLLKLGADDYLAKPFDLDELVARIEVQLRHRRHDAGPHGGHGSPAGNPTERALTFRSWTLDPDARTFVVDGAEIDLTRIDFNIIEVLMRQPKRVFSKQELFEQAWGEPYAADDNTVNVHVSNIRAKLKASGTDTYIKTVWGMGFKLVEE